MRDPKPGGEIHGTIIGQNEIWANPRHPNDVGATGSYLDWTKFLVPWIPNSFIYFTMKPGG